MGNTNMPPRGSTFADDIIAALADILPQIINDLEADGVPGKVVININTQKRQSNIVPPSRVIKVHKK